MIIDPQIDFISGSLPVPGAMQAMNDLSEYIQTSGQCYKYIIVTADRHPISHCSFKRNGGKWNVHCVADSVGAAIWQPLMDSFLDFPSRIEVFHKGEIQQKEEYSIFNNNEATEKILEVVKAEDISQIDICGLAGDICVAETLKDGISILKDVRFRVLTDFSPSLDGGAVLNDIISEYNLQ